MENNRVRSIVSESVAIGSVIAFGYLILLSYQVGIETFYGLPPGFNTINPLGAMKNTLRIMAILFILYSLLELLSYIIPALNNAILLRLKRIVPLVGVTFIIASSSQEIEGALLLSGIVLASFLISDFLLPLFALRHSKNKWEDFNKNTHKDIYRNSYTYLKSKSILPTIAYILLIVGLSLSFASSQGYESVKSKQWFIVLNTNPREVVLIDYGDYLLTSQYDENNPATGPWNTNLRYIQKSELSKTGFRYSYIPNYYKNDKPFHD